MEEARDAYQQAIDIRPDGYEAHANLGTVYQQMGDLPAARQWYVRALRHAPEHAGILLNMAMVAESQAEVAEARQHYERVIAMRPDWKKVRNRLSRLGTPA